MIGQPLPGDAGRGSLTAQAQPSAREAGPAAADGSPLPAVTERPEVLNARHNAKIAWMRLPVSAIASGFLLIFCNIQTALGWLLLTALCEGATFIARRNLAKGDARWRVAHLATLFSLSCTWIVFAALLWSTTEEIAHLAAIVGLFTAALYGVTSGHASLRVQLVLAGPILATLIVILVTYAWLHEEPFPAMVTSLATLGACAIIAVNGVALHRNYRRLLNANAQLALLNQQDRDLARIAREHGEARSRLLANVSHDIRNPLNGVTTSARLLNRGALTPEQARLVGIILASGDAIARMAGDLLDLSAIEARQLSIRPEPVILADLLQTLVAQHRDAIDAKKLALHVQISPELADPVLLDATRFQQIVGNLLSNAVKFTGAGHIAIDVARRTPGSEDQPVIEVAVSDTGAGFGEVDPETLFDRFNRGGQAHSSLPGLGLGLSIARILAEALGGRLTAMALPVGSRFTLELPLIAAGPAPMADAKAQTPRARPLRILVADDHDANRYLMEVMLESFGASADIVGSGDAAIDSFRTGSFDLVILDGVMPGRSGIETAHELRRIETSEERARTPIILLTAAASPDLERASAEAGCDACHLKPIAPDRLAETISRLCSAREDASPPTQP